ncbi:transport and Golgi organization protein 2 homolog isoform X2 [Caretta caretta]|uniref:transport and Golgi organization protein 2 homolog isoform X2 n=1 Tax=Caretta caretta TaxID=8467 RepID=UPI003F4B54E1
MDVEALYTNIPHKDGLQAIKNTIPDNVTANLVAELCDFVLTHNYFTFGDNVYLQISGTAMGTRMAPQYANIFMADLEQRFLSSRPLKPLLYLRYIDDIFIIWTHGKEALEEFHHDFNNFHPTTNLSLVQSTQEIHFLDTTVLINNGHINTTLYRKPTDRYSYLHASSFHPDHTTRSIVYSQALRYNRICSNPSDRDKHLQDLRQAFLQLQYPPAEVKKQIDRARRVPRSYLLQDRPNKENNRTPLAVTFSPQLKPLQRIIKDLQPILKDDPTLSQVLGDRPVLAYRQPRNLKQILTNNHIPHNRTTNPGTYPCNKARCQLCPHIYSGDTITGPNNISHTIRGSFTCTSTNVIYAIMCQQCPSAMYIGQTGQSLRKRINGHKSDVKNYNIHKPVGEHFNLSGHAITDMKVAILKQKNFKSRLQRETAELEFICKLDTINLGLNRDWEWLSHYARDILLMDFEGS